MDFICPTCGEKIPRDLLKIIPHTEDHIAEEIKKKNPKWAEESGACDKCYDYYKDQLDTGKKNSK